MGAPLGGEADAAAPPKFLRDGATVSATSRNAGSRGKPIVGWGRRCPHRHASVEPIRTRPTCRSSRRNEAKPPSPPNRPLPNNIPNSPAPRKPAASPPSRPGRLKNPALGAIGETGRAAGTGCVIVRSIGRAMFGAVAVGGGSEKVRTPRLPTLILGAASAAAPTNASVTATISSANDGRRRNMLVILKGGEPVN